MIAEVEQLAGPVACSTETPFSEEFLARIDKIVEEAKRGKPFAQPGSAEYDYFVEAVRAEVRRIYGRVRPTNLIAVLTEINERISDAVDASLAKGSP